ncbi:MAG: isoleucine--tRNA ligase [Actinobacteria bacterium]|nr:isoleucine--tRNA ligase [Actinomycetota bacterium]
MAWREPTSGGWVAMENAVLAFWAEHDVFARSVRGREGAPPYVFYEGPPTANGRPGSHHVLSRVFKDIFPRFHTMRGRFVDRRGGWDCHGLPVELEVEKQLGISGKPEIEAYGIAEFNARCRDSVLTYLNEWERLTERIGMWIDTDRAYRTMDTDYIESVWWALGQMAEKGLIHESDKVVPYCPRCGTALSSHEVAQGYKDITDPSVYVRFPLTDGSGESLLVWTTTPWTLPANQGAAIHPDVIYAVVQDGDERLILAEPLVEKVMGEDATVLERRLGTALVGAGYAPPFPFVPGAHRVVAADFVTTDDGTGIVHIAPAFGEDDMRVGRAEGFDAPNPIDREGRFTDRVPLVEGVFAKDADRALIDDLASRGLLVREQAYEHSYPHCWRCSTPLLYYAKPSWYVRTTAVRDRMLELNAKIGWHPERVRDGRFGRWLEGNVDWAISRERYWGTPLPFWRCADVGCGHVDVLSSFAELRERANETVGEDLDPHRPYVDDITIACSACGGVAHRVPEVLDVWFDSGTMPFAQVHHPFDTGGDMAGRFPADFICEAIDQTRGWFYSLLAVSTIVADESSYRNVVCLGLILDGEGHKMSKSRGNIIEPWEVLDRNGADPFRWYLLTAQSPWDSFRFSLDAVDESMRFLLTLWNTYVFLVTYAALPDGWTPGVEAPPVAERPEMDRWILARLDATTDLVTEHLEAYDATGAGRALERFVDDLSNWYVRLSRARFWGGRTGGGGEADHHAAFATLHECLVTVAGLLAPFCPFVAEEIYGTLVAAHDSEAPSSVHLTDFPLSGGRRDPDLESAAASAQAIVRLGRGARAESKLKVRQPLAEAVVACPPATAESVQRMEELIKAELNVRSLRFVTDPGDLVDVSLKPNYRSLGPRFGKSMPGVAAAVAGLPANETARRVDAGEAVAITVDGEEHHLQPEDLLVSAHATEGYAVGNEAGLAVGLATDLTDDLLLEGLAREVVHAIQNARRAADLRVEDRIRLHLDGSGRIREAIDVHRERIAADTLATEISVGHGAPFAPVHREDLVVDGEPLAILIDRAD